MAEIIQNGMVVTAAYTMSVDGSVMEEAPQDDPLYYLHGTDDIVPGLERALLGKTVGDRVSVTLAPADAYGEYDEESVEEMSIEELGLDPADVTPGTMLTLEDEEEALYDATVREVNGDTVLLDFNEPLAGKTVHFEVEVLDVRVADEEELEVGLPRELWDDEFEDDHEGHNHA